MGRPKTYNVFGPELHDAYLEALEKNEGLYAATAKVLGCKQTDIHDYRRDNFLFDQECKEVEQRVRDKIIAEVHRRGVQGIKKAIIGGRDRNEVVHEEVVYSDQLLLALAKRGADGSFTERQEITHKGELGLKAEMDYSRLSPRARKMLRDLLQVIIEDDQQRQAVPTTTDDEDSDGVPAPEIP